MPDAKVALVTGAAQGVGFEICRQLAALGWKVLLTARNEEAGSDAAEKLRAEGGDVDFHLLDVTDSGAIQRVRDHVERELGRLDVLVNNAAVSPEKGAPATQVDMPMVRAVMDTNLFGAWELSLAFIPLMKQAGGGRIIMVSSGKGSFTKLEGNFPAYRISKTALNALTVVLAHELRESNIQVNVMTPGWVRTKLGGYRAPRSAAEGADTAVWLATLDGQGPTGKFFRDRQEFPW